jgi:hypothetical protein
LYSAVEFFSRFVLIGRNATYPTDHSKLRSKLIQQASFPESSAAIVTLPVVKDASVSIYEQYVKRATVHTYKYVTSGADIMEFCNNKYFCRRAARYQIQMI